MLVAEKMHKRLVKAGAEAKAQAFRTAAQAIYPQSMYFSDDVQESDKDEEKEEPEEEEEEDDTKAAGAEDKDSD